MKFVDHDEKFSKSKMTALWINSILIVLSFSLTLEKVGLHESATQSIIAPILGLSLNKYVVLLAFWIAGVYTSTAFYFHTRRALYRNSQLVKGGGGLEDVIRTAVTQLEFAAQNLLNMNTEGEIAKLEQEKSKLSNMLQNTRNNVNSSISEIGLMLRHNPESVSSESIVLQQRLDQLSSACLEIEQHIIKMEDTIYNSAVESIELIRDKSKKIGQLREDIDNISSIEKRLLTLSDDISKSARIEWRFIDVNLPLIFMAFCSIYTALQTVIILFIFCLAEES